MLKKDIILFLQLLKTHNNKEWFEANRGKYNEIRESLVLFTEVLINLLSETDPEIKNISASKCLFRINRDVRFSKDKSPYKTNFGIEISKNGRRSDYASYYIHIEPGNSFIGGGIYMPEPNVLKNIRQTIYNYSEEFSQIIEDKEFKATFGELEDFGKLKNAPKGFDENFGLIDILKNKHFVVGTSIDDTELTSNHFLEKVTGIFEILYPFNRFLNSAIDL